MQVLKYWKLMLWYFRNSQSMIQFIRKPKVAKFEKKRSEKTAREQSHSACFILRFVGHKVQVAIFSQIKFISSAGEDLRFRPLAGNKPETNKDISTPREQKILTCHHEITFEFIIKVGVGFDKKTPLPSYTGSWFF